MVASNMLLQLIAGLQHDTSVAHGRHVLLDYVRKSSGARLALLFQLYKKRQALVLLERSGRRPGHSSSVDALTETEQHLSGKVHSMDARENEPDRIQPFAEERSEHIEIALDGLFGMTLDMQGFLHIPNVHSDPRSLEEERYWAWHGGHVIVSAIGAKRREEDMRGVLVLCFGPEQPEAEMDALEEGNLLICIALLSAYLNSANNDDQESNMASIQSMPQRVDDGEQAQKILLHTAELQAAIDQERSRIARDLHDGIAQNIAHVIHKLELVRRICERQPQVAQRELDRTRDVLIDTLRDLRHSISSLLPMQLEEQGFDEAIQSLLQEFRMNEPGVRIDYQVENLDIWPPSLEIPVYRLIQEALNNVRKHAHASRVTIRIQALTGLLIVQVSDNGTGFLIGRSSEDTTAEEATTSPFRKNSGFHAARVTFGLRTMQERVRQAGGILEISSKPGKGTTIKARFPLKEPSLVLTRREREVLQLLVEGATNRIIAQKLSVSIETVKSHVHHIMQKMQVKDRTQAAVVATRQRWL